MTTETERWHRIWSHREQLLKVARRRSVSVDDAEDAVHEAMLRASERSYLDDDRLGGWLTTVTIRLCVDRHRQVTRDGDVHGRTRCPVPVPVEEVVCDRAEARWVAHRTRELPPRQAEALWLKAEDLDVDQVARKMGLNYRTVESLLARARRTLRRSLAGTMVVLLGGLAARPRPGTAAVQTVGAVSTAATLAVLGVTLPGSSAPDGPATQSHTRYEATGTPPWAADHAALVTAPPALPSGGRALPSDPTPLGDLALSSDVVLLGDPALTDRYAGTPVLDLLRLPETSVPQIAGITGLTDALEALRASELPVPSEIPNIPDVPLPATPTTPVPAGDSVPLHDTIDGALDDAFEHGGATVGGVLGGVLGDGTGENSGPDEMPAEVTDGPRSSPVDGP